MRDGDPTTVLGLVLNHQSKAGKARTLRRTGLAFASDATLG